MTDKSALIDALRPLVRRVRTDVTAIKKAAGGQMWTQESLTDERLARHLNGGPARGVSPIKPGESVTLVAVLDFDSHRGEVAWGEMAATAGKVFDALDLAWGCRPLAFRSSGGAGVHLVLVWDEPQDAGRVRRWLGRVLGACGYRSGTAGVRAGEVEVFPRQDRVRPGGYGNQFILPLAGKSEWLQYDELAGTLAPAREPLTAGAWVASPAVPADAEGSEESPGLKDQAGAEGRHGATSGGDYDRASVPREEWPQLWEALAAIPNTGKGQDYDVWRNVGFAVHHATGGDPEGLDMLDAWSAQSDKHTPGYMREKVWDHATRAARSGEDPLVRAGTLFALASQHGWVNPQRVEKARAALEEAAAAFQVLEAPPGEVAPPVERRGVPLAKHLTTDQANAVRMARAYGGQVCVAAGKWMVWNGKVWVADEAAVYRFACRLSEMVREEARAWLKKAPPASDDEDDDDDDSE